MGFQVVKGIESCKLTITKVLSRKYLNKEAHGISLHLEKLMTANALVDFVRSFPDNPTKEEVEVFKKEFTDQEKILQLLQKENEHLLQERRTFLERIKELEEKNVYLESKSSAQQIAGHFSESLQDPKDSVIKSLRKTICELNEGINEAEAIKNSMRDQLQKCSVSSEINVHSISQNNGDKRTPTSQAYQHRLISQLRETIAKKEEEIKALRDLSTLTKIPVVTQTSGADTLPKGNEDSVISSAAKHIDLTLKKNQDLESKLEFYAKRINQLEMALVEKDKCAKIAVANMKSESDKIRSYYENAIRSIVLNQKTFSKESTEGKLPLSSAVDVSLENNLLEKRILGLEGKIHEIEEVKKPLEASVSDRELFLLRSEKEDLFVKLKGKEKELEIYRIESQKTLYSELEKMRNMYTQKINEINEKHRDALKSLERVQLSNEFKESIRRKWVNLKKNGPESFMNAVIDRLTFLENCCAQKDIEMDLNIKQVLRVAKMEYNLEKQKAELCIEQKNIQIQEFQCHLDSLLRGILFLKNE